MALSFWRVLPITFGLLVWRAYPRLVHPGIWAEDGAVFLSEVLERGVFSLLEPYAGYYDLLQHLILVVIRWLVPISGWAFAISLCCILLFAVFAATLVSRDYEWLLPNPRVRLASALLVCVLPGLNEMLGNLANINWILILWMGLWALQDPHVPFSPRQLAASFLILLSTGAFAVVLPVYLWRIWYVKFHLTPVRTARNERLLTAGLAAMTILLAILVKTGISKPLDTFAPDFRPDFGMGVLVYSKHLFRVGIFRPWLGSRYASRLVDHFPDGVGLLAGVAVLGFLIWRLWSYRRDPRVQAVVVFALGISIWPVMACLTRPGAIQLFLKWESLAPMWTCRYAFPMSYAGLLFWMLVIGLARENLRRHRLGTAALAILLVLNVSHARRSFRIHAFAGSPPVEAELWKNGWIMLKNAMDTGCPPEVKIPISPSGWSLGYRARPAVVCPPKL